VILSSNNNIPPRNPRERRILRPHRMLVPGSTRRQKNFRDYKWTPLNASLTEVLMELKKDPNY
jgi:hypothetical protein